MYNLNETLTWALRYQDKCVLYLLEWEAKLYVGSSSNLSSRLYWWRAEFGPNSEHVQVSVYSVVSAATRFAEEAALIRRLNTVAEGHNRTADGRAGASIGHTCSEATKAKISKANTGRRRTQETKIKMRLRKLGKPWSPLRRASYLKGLQCPR